MSNIASDRADLWSKVEAGRIAAADDLHVSPLREHAKRYGTPTWIWSVAIDGALYVRAYNGKASRWYQAALKQKAGRITAAGMTKDVVFVPVRHDQECGSGIRAAGNPDQRGMPGHHRYADGRRHARRSGRCHGRDHKAAIDRTTGSRRGSCGCRPVAMQPGRELRRRGGASGRRWLHSALTARSRQREISSCADL